MPRSLSDLTVQEWLDSVAGPKPVPGSGCASAMNAATAAAVIAKAAGKTPGGHEIAAQALTLRSRLVGLAEVDFDVYGAAREALASAENEPDDDQRELAVIPVAEAAEAVILIAEGAADVAALAGEAAAVSDDEVPANAQAAAALAAGAAEAAAHLVAVFIPSGPGLRRAREAAERAAAVARRLAVGDSVQSPT